MNYNRLKYSRGQQIIFVVLACFIVVCFATNLGIRKFYPHSENHFTPDSLLLSDIALFETKLDSFEWLRKQEFSPRRITNIPRERFYFDPNTIDSTDIL